MQKIHFELLLNIYPNTINSNLQYYNYLHNNYNKKEKRGITMDKQLTINYGKHCIGQVLRILDNRTIIISTSKENIFVGDSIAVYEVCDEIKDLNGKYLCNYEHIKDTLEVVDTNEYYSVCRKKAESINRSNFLLSPMLSKKIYEPLNISKDDIEPFHVKSNLIKKGDPIKKI